MKYVETERPDKYECYSEPSNGNFIAKCGVFGAFMLTFSLSTPKAYAAPKPKPAIEWRYDQNVDIIPQDLVSINAPVVDMVRLPFYAKIDSISLLGGNWDGYGSEKPNCEAIKNARHLIETLDRETLKFLATDAIYPSSYGSLILDFETKRGLVSVEIGDSTMGFFTDFIDGNNYAAEGISTDFVSVPTSLESCLS